MIAFGVRRRVGARKKTFTPLSISGLSLWLDPSDPATLSLDGDLVSAIHDKSGHAHVGVSSGTQRPALTTVEGMPMMSFDNTDDCITVNDHPDFDHASSGFTVMAIIKQNIAAYNMGQSFINKTGPIGTREWRISYQDNNNGHYIMASTNGTGIVIRNLKKENKSTRRVIMMRYFGPGTRSEILFDSSVPKGRATNAATIYEGIQPIRIGHNGESEFLNGSIGEVLYYNRGLSDAEINMLGAYLEKKWNINYASQDEAILVTNARETNAFNAFVNGSLYSHSYTRNGLNAQNAVYENYFKAYEFVRNAYNTAPVMQVSGNGSNH
ncbi:MAG: hypothetical protein ACK4VI_06085 [Alphaproteobacteria bacterium]